MYILHVLHCILCSTVTALGVFLESQPPQPNCTNITLTFNCQLTFSSFNIQWKHTKLESLGFLVGDESVGDTVKKADGRVVAILTMKDSVQGSANRFLFSSTLTIHPPLNNVNNTNLNTTDITCEGIDLSGIRSRDAPISLYGEQLRLYLIIH